MVDKITNRSTQTTRSLTVFFDGSCPICSKEINFYKMRAGADKLSWVDVSDEEVPISIQTRSREDLMARFHVLSSDGELVSGGAAFSSLTFISLAVSSVQCLPMPVWCLSSPPQNERKYPQNPFNVFKILFKTCF